jgi:threonine/homoserine/homoserine lactone efflux protein
MMYVASRSVSQGIKAGIISAVGVFTGCFVHILAAVLGLSIIIAQSAWLFQLIKYAGAVYLVYLGVKIILTKTKVNNADEKPTEPEYGKLYKQGIITNALNPKVAVFFLSFLPQFVDGHSPFFKVQLLMLGLWFALQGTAVLIIVALIVGNTKDFLRRNPKAWLIQEKITGIIFVGLGIRIALAAKK